MSNIAKLSLQIVKKLKFCCLATNISATFSVLIHLTGIQPGSVLLQIGEIPCKYFKDHFNKLHRMYLEHLFYDQEDTNFKS